MQTTAVPRRPSPGTSQKAAASTPITAPSVLLAYRAAMDRPCARRCTVRRSIAGSVAPIAAVAGSSSTKLPRNATDHCHSGAGCTPVSRSSPALIGATANTSSRPHRAMTSSHPAYQRTGRRLRSMRAPSVQAPVARPPKNAATTASNAADSWPSHSVHCWVQTI